MVLDEKYIEQTDELFKNQGTDSLPLVPANVSTALAYHQLQGITQSQLIISLSPEISQLLDSNIPHQLSISYNTTNTHIAQLAQLYNTFSTLFISYVNSNNIGTNPPSLEEQEYQDINPFIYNLHKYLLFHDTLHELLQIELSPEFIQQCDDFHQYDILHSIIKYVRHFPTQLTVNLVENIFHIWPQYIASVNSFIE